MNPIARRPWLLVVLAFLVLIGAWVATIAVARKHPIQRLTPAEESELLQAQGAGGRR
jgi:hypothetical protein